MAYDPNLGYDPADPTGTAAGRSMLAAGGVNTLGSGMPDATTDPTGYLAAITALQASPMGQAAINAMGQTAAMNVKIANAQIKNAAAQIAIQKGEAAANAWYQQQQVKIAQQAHELAVQTQQQNYAIQSGQLTGTFNGQPTLPALGQQAQYTGLYGSTPTLQNLAQTAQYTGLYGTTPTLQAQNQAQQFGLQQGQLTGLYQGTPTFQAQQAGVQNAQNWANILGYDPTTGQQTLANQQFQTNAYGYGPNGAPTLAREQAAAGTALQAGQLAASLQGPGNWAKFLQAQNGIAGSPASALVQSRPGGLGAASGPNPAPLTLASVLNGYGVMPQAGGSGGGNAQNGQQVYAGGSPSFNEATGQYTMPGAQGATPGRSSDVYSGGAPASYAEQGAGQYGGFDANSPLGALYGVANAPRVSNADLGLSDQEASTLQGYFNNPNSAPVGWWESKSPDERSYLNGLDQYWGGSPDTFQSRYQNSRTRQGAWNQAA